MLEYIIILGDGKEMVKLVIDLVWKLCSTAFEIGLVPEDRKSTTFVSFYKSSGPITVMYLPNSLYTFFPTVCYLSNW